MANIHEITRNLIQMRGEVKAAIVRAGGTTAFVKLQDNRSHLELFISGLQFINADNFTGCIWFQSGSYAYLDKDGAGYYWNYVTMPEIPKELC